MKWSSLMLLTAGAAGVLLTGCAVVKTPASQAGESGVVARLEVRAQQLEWAAQGTKGAHAALLGMQRVRVKQLIERIKAGENVDSQEIEALLRKDVHSVR
jgi:hypothetical protein